MKRAIYSTGSKRKHQLIIIFGMSLTDELVSGLLEKWIIYSGAVAEIKISDWPCFANI